MLLPRGNGKTTLFAVLALYHLLSRDRAKVYLAASSTDQASIAFETASELVQANKRLQSRVRSLPGYKLIRRIDQPGFIKVMSSDADRAMGAQPTLVLVDELHAHKDDRLYVALKTAMGKHADAQLVTISTAGWDDEGPLALMRQAALELPSVERDGTLTVARNPASNFTMLEWACPDDADLADPAAVKAANPASFVTEEFLAEQIASPDLHPLEFARYHANVWTGVAESWLQPGAWEACRDDAEIGPDDEVYVGVDIGRKYDRTAIAVVSTSDPAVVRCRVLDPPDKGSIDLATVEGAIREVAGGFRVQGVVYDPWSFERSAQILADEGLPMIEHPMSNERMVKASNMLYEAIQSRRIRHDGDPVLAAHVAAGSQKDTERGWRLAKNAKAKRPIDALIATCIAYSVAGQHRGSMGVEWW